MKTNKIPFKGPQSLYENDFKYLLSTGEILYRHNLSILYMYNLFKAIAYIHPGCFEYGAGVVKKM